jgi:Holliday junction resolvase RusA-like endonuclease
MIPLTSPSTHFSFDVTGLAFTISTTSTTTTTFIHRHNNIYLRPNLSLLATTRKSKSDERFLNDVIIDDGMTAKVGEGLEGKTRQRRKSNDGAMMYWYDDNDPFVIVTDDINWIHDVTTTIKDHDIGEKQRNTDHQNGSVDNKDDDDDDDDDDDRLIKNRRRKHIKFTIRGSPRVLIRHRTARGFMYNPSASAQEAFCDTLLNLLPLRYRPIFTDDDEDNDKLSTVPTVLFPQNECLKLTILFRMKRPLSHFIASKPGPGRLKSAFAGQRLASNNRCDVDNLAKFVLDSLNGLLYVDDKQVVSLNVLKVYDTEGSCLGATEVEISVMKEEDLL